MATGGRKANSTPTAAATNASGGAASSSNTDAPPAPFELASSKLLPFTKTLPRDHVFVVHLERTPVSLRRQAFVVPIALNSIIALGLCWRLFYAVPTYLELLITIFGYDTKWTVDQNAISTTDLLTIIARRTVLLIIDYVLFGLLARWPWEFVFGDKYGRYTGMAGWKWEVGFAPKEEVIVRRGRKWDSPMYAPELERKMLRKPENTWSKEEEIVAHTKCSEALRRSTTMKTALGLLDPYWDLDYRAMLDATELVKEGKISLEDLDHVVIVPWNGKTYSWYPHKGEKAVPAIVEDNSEAGKKLQKFKKCLIDINCEDVFYRWIEIVQYETSLISGFTLSRKQEAVLELRRLIKAKGKDDNAFFQAVGGTSGIPGLSKD